MAGGRPTDYKEEYAEQSRKLCLLGYTDVQLADFYGVTEQTINNWKKKHDGFFESLKAGKDIADAEVVNTLYNKAIGGIEIEEVKTDDGGKVTTTIKELAPDTTSAIFWLKNRQPEKWRDKQEIETSSKSIEDSLADIANKLPT